MHQYRFKCIARKFQPYLNKHGAVVFKTGSCRFYSRRSRGWSRLTWPKELLYQAQEEKGCCFGSKSAILEAVGLLIPLIAFLDFIASKQLVFKVDNSELMWVAEWLHEKWQISFGYSYSGALFGRIPGSNNFCITCGQNVQKQGKL